MELFSVLYVRGKRKIGMVKFYLLALRSEQLSVWESSQTRKRKNKGDSELCGRGWNLPAQVKELVSNQKREVTSSGMRGKLARMGTDINR